MGTSYPPNETPSDVAAFLRRNHPEMSDDEIAALIGGEPPKRRKDWGVNRNMTAGVRGPAGKGIVRAGGLKRANGRRRRHRA
jgi:hypothetical protein